MVEFTEDTVNQTCICKSDKFVSDFIIQKSNDGFIFFEIRLEKGTLPAALSGRYTTMRSAQKAVVAYVNSAKETKAAKREYFNKRRQERKLENGTEDQSEGS
jgi:hypothetical protein